jgi:hypothetical protein
VTQVGEPSGADRRWQALAEELAPAKSLQRIDAANARVVATVSAVATVLTGIGLVAAGSANLPDLARWVAVAAVGLAVTALLVAMLGQKVTVSRDVKLNNLAAVEQWYRHRIARRAPLARVAAWLLVAAVGCAAVAAGVSLVAGVNEAPTLAVTRTADTVTVDVTFRGLDPDQSATATVTVDGRVVAAAVFGQGVDGTATRTLGAAGVPAAAVVRVDARAGGEATCIAEFAPGSEPTLTCPSQ